MSVLDDITDEKLKNNLKIVREYFLLNARDVTKNVTQFLRNQKTVMKLDTAFDLVMGPQEEIKAAKYLDIILSCSVSYLNGKDPDELVEKNLRNYLKYETVASNLKKRHPKFPLIEPLEKDLFKSRIILYSKLLQGEGTNYSELSRSVIPTKEESLKNAQVEIELEEEIATVMKLHRGIIMAPGLIKIEVLEASLFAFQYVHDKILSEIDSIYGK